MFMSNQTSLVCLVTYSLRTEGPVTLCKNPLHSSNQSGVSRGSLPQIILLRPQHGKTTPPCLPHRSTPISHRFKSSDYTSCLCHVIYLHSLKKQQKTYQPPALHSPSFFSSGDPHIPHSLTGAIHHRRVSEARHLKVGRSSLTPANVCNVLLRDA